MTAPYPLLFSPLRVGPLTLDNRVVLAAHLTNYAVDGMPTPRHAAYYAARAAGGAGLIVTEEQSTHATDRPYEKLVDGRDPRVVEGYRAITDAVHAHGVPILAQLNHNGGQGSGLYTRLPVWAPSAGADPLFREVPRAVDSADIADVVRGHAIAARHCVDGGFDGVELQCSHSSIVRAFLSPVTNRRTDSYGGPLDNRARLLLELVAEVRAVLGPARVLGVRLCGDELVRGGLTTDDAVAVARLVEAAGGVDYLNTSVGVATSSLYMVEPSMRTPAGYATYVAAAIRAAVALPVVGVGRFTTPAEAEATLAAGHCDLVGVVRGQISDPDFARKARSGAAAEIRTCLSCNQECVARVGSNRWLGCVQNPRAGRESVPGPAPARARLRVYVVGGGPGGLQAAATAAERGHDVTLFERGPSLGGQVAVAARAPGRGNLYDLVRNLAGAATRAGVAVRTGEEVDPEWLLREAPDAVVLATGALPRRPPWAGDADRVVDVRDVLEDRIRPDGEIVVVDDLGFHQATSVAELLAERGCAVEIVTSGMVVGQDLGTTLDIELWTRTAAALRIAQRTDVVPTAARADDGKVVLELLHHPTGAVSRRAADWVVCAVHQRADDALWRGLRGAPFPVHRVGDCLAPRRAHAAVVEGHRVGGLL